VFLQIIADDQTDFAVPGEPYTFSILKQAQALGDFRALLKRGRRVIGIELGKDLRAGIEQLNTAVSTALRGRQAIGQ
jgi:hypothetical protein